MTRNTSDNRTSAKTLNACRYLSDSVNKDGMKYCKFLGINPNPTGATNGYPYRKGIDCPYVKMLKDINGFSETGSYSDTTNDFEIMTLLQIDDISNLLKALFKINIDIAHRECYLKVDIPAKSDWWYGYTDGSKWISFEPTVEYKFSNFHAANQVWNGKLICTVAGLNADDFPTNMWITPINRDLVEDAKTGRKQAIHYNDLYYYYDYKQTLSGIYEGND